MGTVGSMKTDESMQQLSLRSQLSRRVVRQRGGSDQIPLYRRSSTTE